MWLDNQTMLKIGQSLTIIQLRGHCSMQGTQIHTAYCVVFWLQHQAYFLLHKKKKILTHIALFPVKPFIFAHDSPSII